MRRREHDIQITVNGQRITKVIIDPHYEEKHSKTVSDEIKETLNRAEFVGRWFALSGTPVTILTLLGVRP